VNAFAGLDQGASGGRRSASARSRNHEAGP
jgi:hypothetical protein